MLQLLPYIQPTGIPLSFSAQQNADPQPLTEALNCSPNHTRMITARRNGLSRITVRYDSKNEKCRPIHDLEGVIV